MENPLFAATPKPPYYAVIFSSVKKEHTPGYVEMAAEMDELAKQQDGYLGIESAREEIGITVSYWENLEAIQKWKANERHLIAQKTGQNEWYNGYRVRVCKVERDYGF